MTNTAYKIAIIGPKEVIFGFKALGVVPFDAENGETALHVLQEIRKNAENTEKGSAYAVVIIVENIAEEIPADEFEKVCRGALPAVIALPGLEGSRGIGIAKLKRLAERAVGSNILG
ncbi:MAG: V-type ATP synthase subunit F [Candidatus Yonathbacteria bacterium CG_4_10_14_3_um_filter_47_65]|uniref:V-type ATP synthase subunit F n=2 Tax=Parcubacteria group TaxID=1794811 RepID=A0A2M8D722_9BACT|nr:MAG: hypothetical protein AUJ44_01275 [Candidatus Nomurabacteria bacterium CG1_02_47_685]PIP03490.1 MAG: V-type ATP synthase subunit F [Candidatus Yonathbacteria bacterium CG23_combo_of_CG06-09_8_20_14_all_46_18]PIQ32946.1 MAG: V-type ATP synthase subunit F [Candidatus Yonathbacteria bacterium CG17_big_fil_post_rev_8_21_14_2_50_46_19]PIX56167.1 MAG: V-type ATP synthase subunit F [Candidatus Yonathbacteria bacterium CG_4_10_14_3_um_filter_47_65]PIY57637.1 MAG: V-type ATP synthase subunit F [C